MIGREPRLDSPSTSEEGSLPLVGGHPSDTLYATVVTVRPRTEGRTGVELVLQAIQEKLGPSSDDLGPLRRDADVELPPSRFGGFSFRHHRADGNWSGRILWRQVHPLVPGAPITTEVTLEETKSYTRLGLRVTADHGLESVRGAVGAGHAQPLFLQGLREELGFTWLGAPVRPNRISPGDEVDFVKSTLEDPVRTFAAVVIAPTEDGEHLADPSELAFHLMGRGRLFVIGEHSQTFRLTDAVGDKRLSCFWGALRAYLPGFSVHDDPYDHPLLVADRVTDPVMRAATVGELGIRSGREVRLPEVMPEERSGDEDEPAEAPPVPEKGTPVDVRTSNAGDREQETPKTDSSEESLDADQPLPSAQRGEALGRQIEALSAAVRELTTLVHDLVGSNRSLQDEIERLRMISAVRSASTSALERRMHGLESVLTRILEPEWEDPTARADRQEEPAEDRYTLVEAVRDAQEAHPETLLFLDNALASARESPYEDPERVRTILDAMARVARKRRDGELNTSLKEAFADLGIDYRGGIARTTPDRLRQQYVFVGPDDRPIECVEHIALGQTYNPRRCLRIYFSSRVPSETRFVIAHVGRHFEVITST